nr:hypothetical protein [Verrucomicrobiota bacterium JB025]
MHYYSILSDLFYFLIISHQGKRKARIGFPPGFHNARFFPNQRTCHELVDFPPDIETSCVGSSSWLGVPDHLAASERIEIAINSGTQKLFEGSNPAKRSQNRPQVPRLRISSDHSIAPPPNTHRAPFHIAIRPTATQLNAGCGMPNPHAIPPPSP